jgi:hypothetical protein
MTENERMINVFGGVVASAFVFCVLGVVLAFLVIFGTCSMGSSGDGNFFLLVLGLPGLALTCYLSVLTYKACVRNQRGKDALIWVGAILFFWFFLHRVIFKFIFKSIFSQIGLILLAGAFLGVLVVLVLRQISHWYKGGSDAGK